MPTHFKILLLLLLLIPVSFSPHSVMTDITESIPTSPLADEVVKVVNETREKSGLSPYLVNPILMDIAQEQADYMASIGTWTHTGSDGSRPYQRALKAGYLISGDLSIGGIFDEAVRMENNLSPQELVQNWLKDPGDKYILLSDTYEDVGVGVAIVDQTYYYCLDAGLSTHGTPVAYTPPGPTYTATIVQSTPNADGSITHTVQLGDTLLSISIAYAVPLGDILRLNGLTLTSIIYPNEKLIIQIAFTPTPTVPTPTASRIPTSTPWPSSTPSPRTAVTSLSTATLVPKATLSENNGYIIAGAIVLLAILAGGMISFFGRIKK